MLVGRFTIPSLAAVRAEMQIKLMDVPAAQLPVSRYAAVVGRDGIALLGRLGAPLAPAELRAPAQVDVLRRVWERHFHRHGGIEAGEVRLRPEGELPPAAEVIEPPYEPAARYRSKRKRHCAGYAALPTEACDEGRPHLITHVATTTARVHEVECTSTIQEALVGQACRPAIL
jgi:transposase